MQASWLEFAFHFHGGDFSLGLLRWDIVHMGQNVKSGTTSGLTSQAFEFG